MQIVTTCVLSAVGSILFYIALKELPVSLVSIYENGLYVLLTVVLAVVVLKETLPKYSFYYLILCLLGLILLITKGVMGFPEISILGIILLSINALLSAINTTVEMFNLKSLSIFTITFLKSLISGFVMLIMMIIFGQSFNGFFNVLSLWMIVFILYSILNSFAIRYLHLKSMKVLNSSKTALFQMITPVLSALFALMIFNESLNYVQWIGIIMILYSVYKLK